MNTLAIFGDSYADPHSISYLSTEPDKIRNSSWVKLLEQCGDYTVTNFSLKGSSLYYSYQEFMYYHDQYDRVIFLATYNDRWFYPVQYGDDILNFWSYDSCRLHREHYSRGNQLTTELDTILKTVENYYIHLENRSFNDDIWTLMTDKVAQTRPDAIVIPVPSNRSRNREYVANYQTIHSQSAQDYNFSGRNSFSKQYSNIYWIKDEINCIHHMTPELNHVFYLDVIKSLSDGRWNPSPLHETYQHEHPANYYWKV